MHRGNILVTGGTGSLGTELVKQCLELGANKVVAIDINEQEIANALKTPNERARYYYCDIKDYDSLKKAFEGIDYVFHAAALKHVSVGNTSPFEVVKTNVMGTHNIINMCKYSKVKKALFISSDKAAKPSNLYGATKYCAEHVFIDGNIYSGRGGPKLSVARGGNFIGSRGSIIDNWQNTGLYELTDKRMTRYWISIKDAATFFIKCIGMMNGGEIFIPKMEEHNVLEFMQAQPWFDPKIKVRIIGKGKGEKLREDLYSEHENVEDKGEYYVIT